MRDREPRLDRRLRTAGFRGELDPGGALAALTTWRIGGPAELLARAVDRDDLLVAVRWAEREGVPWRVLGNGSNLLVLDAGVRGLVLRTRKVLGAVRDVDGGVIAGAGASLPALARRTAARGLAGLEFGAGVPGTVGGAVVMNAGWHEHEIGNLVESVEFLGADLDVHTADRAACRFGYRASRFRGARDLVLSATLRLTPDDPRHIRRRLERFAGSRKQDQPTELPSCGSVFLKPPGDFAGRLIEQAGLKGRRVGDIQVSPKHANFFVNLGHGTAADALALVEEVEQEVERRFGVRLVREFEVW